MPADIRDALREAAPRELPDLEFDRIVRRYRRGQAVRTGLATAAAGLVVLVVATAAIGLLLPTVLEPPMIGEPDQEAVDDAIGDDPGRPAEDAVEDVTAEPEEPAPLPEARDVLVVQRVIGDRPTITAMRGDGGEMIEVGHGEWPSISPDGTRVAFGSGIRTQSGIQVVGLDGTGHEELTDGYDGYPAWSPDGTLIAFHRQSGEHPLLRDIWVMNADGSDQRLLVEDAMTPAWSPDGTQIAFVRYVPHPSEWTSDVWVVGADGTNERRLVDTPDRIEWFPAWSPDGSQIVFMSNTNGETSASRLDIADADGSNVRLLTRPMPVANHHAQPTWSPDGTSVMFGAVVDQWGTGRLFVVRPDGTGMSRVPIGADEDGSIRYNPGAWFRPAE